jgi:hypothetical protein
MFASTLENQFIYPFPKGSKLIFFAPLGAGVTKKINDNMSDQNGERNFGPTIEE